LTTGPITIEIGEMGYRFLRSYVCKDRPLEPRRDSSVVLLPFRPSDYCPLRGLYVGFLELGRELYAGACAPRAESVETLDRAGSFPEWPELHIS
jgi:hypothetical protein